MNTKAVIFDLDGTLVDSLADLTCAMNYALAEYGCPTQTAEKCRFMIGDGLQTFASRALPADKQNLVDDVMQKMKEYYTPRCMEQTRPYDGILDVVAALHKKNIKLAVVTNKNHEMAVKILGGLFPAGSFDYTLGSKAGESIKPQADATLNVVAKMNVGVDECIFVGDSAVDVQTAQNCGIKFVGVSWGLRGRKELQTAGAEIIIDQPEELLELDYWLNEH